jgi:putative oxidoreductase
MSVDFGILLLRVLFGAAIAAHGAQKVFGLFGGHGLKGEAAFMETLGFRPGVMFAVMAGLSELGGGLILMLGLFTPVGAAAVLSAMIVAMISVNLKNGFFAVHQGIEMEFPYAASALGIAFTGPGVFSLDAVLGLRLLGGPYVTGGLLMLALIGAGITLAIRRQPKPQTRAAN